MHALSVIVLAFGAAPAPVAPAPVDFARQVRPILSEHCFACHGPDVAARKGKLRLDTRDGLFGPGRSGRPAVVAGKAEASELLARITSDDETEVMPPPKAGKKLSPAQADVLRRWVAQGAPWAEHWAFMPPRRPAVPVRGEPGRARNPIDRFILARLDREGLAPSPEAARATLLRRVTLDLTGVPPTPAEVRAFLADDSPGAYERVVDRLLAAPGYGERMAQQWLDGARYADSNGYQSDNERTMWPWRDWVIGAYNANKPFDEFTVEQMAGDLLPDSPGSVVATGFHRNHRINTEGGIIAEEWRVELVADRLETTAAVWLGLTMNCAKCHDHKYDPVAQKDYYRLFAFFDTTPESGIGVEGANTPPLIKAPGRADLARQAELEREVARAEAAVKAREADLDPQLAAWEKTALALKPGPVWTPTTGGLKAAGGASLTAAMDGAVTVSGANPDRDSYSLTAGGLKRLSAVRVELLPDARQAGNGPGRSVNGNVVMTGVRVEAGGKPLKVARAMAAFSQDGYPVESVLKGGPGWAIYPRAGQAHTATFLLESPADVAGQPVTITLQFQSGFAGHQPGRFRVTTTDSDRPLEDGELPGAVRAILETPRPKRSPAQVASLRTFYRSRHAGAVTDADRALDAAKKARADHAAKWPTVMVLAEMPGGRDTHVLVRGQYDRRGEKVTPGVPAALPPLPAGVKADRLGLARWMVDPGNPLTARVAVNRLWEQLLGQGLVRSGDNLGLQGEPPSHPELLDWLAVEFVEGGWDVKRLARLIVTSATYRQSSAVSPALRERDPENRLLARASRHRLAAENVRDNALAAAGLLVERVGGPSVRPYQPSGVWDETSVYGNLRNYQHDRGDGLHRRSLYTIWKRTAAPPTMLLFDSPSREICAVRRPRTNTPLQALALLNEVTFVEAARALGEKMIAEGGGTPEGRVRAGFLRATGREPDAAELRVLAAGLRRRQDHFARDVEGAKKLLAVGDYRAAPGADPAELAACAMTAAVILNLDETITRE